MASTALQCVQAPYGDVDFKQFAVLEASDNGKAYKVPLKAALTCKLIKELSEASDEPLLIPTKVEDQYLRHLVAYLCHHCDNPAAPIERPLPKPIEQMESVSKFDKAFITALMKDWDVSRPGKQPIHCVAEAANFLGANDLMSLACAGIVSMIKDKSVEEIRELYGITESGFTAEEEAKILEENAWILEC